MAAGQQIRLPEIAALLQKCPSATRRHLAKLRAFGLGVSGWGPGRRYDRDELLRYLDDERHNRLGVTRRGRRR